MKNMTKISKESLRVKARNLAHKMSVKNMKLTVCDECASSSSEEDQTPIIPPWSSDESDELSPIEEERNIDSTSGTSKYTSPYNSSITSISSMSEDEDASSYKPLHNVANNDVCPTQMMIKEDRNEQVESHQSSVEQSDTVVDVGNIGFAPFVRQAVRQSDNSESSNRSLAGSPSYITLTPTTCEFNDIHRSKNFTFLLMNFALVASNGNQLRYLMDSQDRLKFFYISLGLIIASCVFQFIAKLFSFVSYCYSVHSEAGIKRLKCLNTFIVLFAFLTTVVNIGLSVVLVLEFYDIIPL
jgi:hypothetical protein